MSIKACATACGKSWYLLEVFHGQQHIFKGAPCCTVANLGWCRNRGLGISKGVSLWAQQFSSCCSAYAAVLRFSIKVCLWADSLLTGAALNLPCYLGTPCEVCVSSQAQKVRSACCSAACLVLPRGLRCLFGH
jgi:hypothetical protein